MEASSLQLAAAIFNCFLFCSVFVSLQCSPVYPLQSSTGTHRSLVGNHDLSLCAYKNCFSVEAKRSRFQNGQFFRWVLAFFFFFYKHTLNTAITLYAEDEPLTLTPPSQLVCSLEGPTRWALVLLGATAAAVYRKSGVHYSSSWRND